MKGTFISFEGIEGCGKTTQMNRLRSHLDDEGYKVIVTREPGGTPIAEAIRTILLDPANRAMCDLTELMLYEAARAQHMAERIVPALDSGHIVLCDRFVDSTTAYQSAGRRLPESTVYMLHELATGGIWPKLTILLDVPVELGLRRAARRRASDRIEQEDREFHNCVREGFLRLAKREPARIRTIDGTRPVDDVAAEISQLVENVIEDQ